MNTRRETLRKYLVCFIFLSLLCHSHIVCAQFLWNGKYATRAEAEAAMKLDPTPQYIGLVEPWYEEFHWWDPATTIYWYTIFDYQPVSSSTFRGYAVSPSQCGIWGGTECHETLDDAVDAWATGTYPFCDVEFTVGEFEFQEQQWVDVLEHGIRFWAIESAPLDITVYYPHVTTGECQSPQIIHSSMLRTSLAECDLDMSPVTRNASRLEPKPRYPEVCSPSGHQPPISNLAAISKRITSICTATEGNPCSPMTGHKSLAETDFNSGHLNVERFYNSSLEFGSGQLGAGWDHNYSARLIFSGGYTLANPGGNVVQFASMSNGDYRSVNDPGMILARTGSLAQVTYEGGRKEIYELVSQYVAEPDQFRLVEIYEAELPDRPMTLSYDSSSGLLDSVTDPFGRQLHFERSGGLRISAIVLPDGERIKYAHDSSGNLFRVTFQDGSQRTYLYENPALPNHLTGIMDENSNRYATYGYDPYGRVTLSEHAGGADAVALNYFTEGTTEVTMPLGDIRRYSYDQNRPTFEVQELSDGSGAVTYSRNADGWQTERIDARGHISRYTYDEHHLIQRTEGSGTDEERSFQYSWDNSLNRQTSLAEPGALTAFSYDSEGRLESRTIQDLTSGSQRSWTYTYFDANSQPAEVGRLWSIDGPRSDVADVTSFGYYSADDANGYYRAGDLHTIRNALGHVTEYLEYDANGRVLKVKDPNGVLTTMAYHARGWISRKTTDGQATTYAYDSSGNLTRIVQADGSYLDYEYDDAHRLTTIADNFDNRIEFVLDAAGNRVSAKTYDNSGGLHRQLSRAYDQLNRLGSLVDGNNDQNRHHYDDNGNRISTQDANLNTTRFEYDSLNRLVKTIDANLGEILLDYDDRDQLVGVSDPLGNVTQYAFDGLDNQIELVSADTGITTYEYDEAGNRTAATDARGIRSEYTYDALNRLTAISYPDSVLDVIFRYDAGGNGKGRLTGMTDAAGAVDFAYDARGNLLSETRTINGETYITSYAYNEADRLIQIKYPSGMVIDYVLDAAGRITAVDRQNSSAVVALASDIEYKPFGPVTAFTYGNGLTFTAIFDQDYELDQLQSGSDLNWLLDFDPAGNILAIADQVDQQNNQAFSYDVLYRLEAAQGRDGGEAFEYDVNGNRIFYESNSEIDSYSYENQSNRLAARNGRSIVRDAAGNRSTMLDAGGYGQLYSYGDHNRLSQISIRGVSGDTVVGDYQYDGRGQRINKLQGGASIRYIHGISGELLGEYSSAADGGYKEYVYLHGLPIAVISGSTQTVQLPGEERIMDDGDLGTSSAGSWRSKSNAQDFGAGYQFANKAPNRSYRWTVTPPGSEYRLYAWWVSRNNQSDNVTYTIGHGDGETDFVTRSHKTGGGQWQYLGSYSNSGGQDYVEVSSTKNKFVADAIRWVEIVEPITTFIETTNYIHFDHLGAPRRVTDDAQTVVWRWDSKAFGDSLPDEDPDGDAEPFVLNLRFPGQYYDAESGLHHNYFRIYDPEIGRYIESDPIGLEAGTNTFSYVGANPLLGIDPLGLVVTGSWIEPPRFNLTDIGVDDWELVSPSWSWWGYAKFIRLFGHAAGFINVDVKCNSECKEWEIHNKIIVEASGHYDVGPNIYAIIIGLRAGPVAGVGANVAIGGVALLAAEHHNLNLANEKAGPVISSILASGPTAICLGTSQGY